MKTMIQLFLQMLFIVLSAGDVSASWFRHVRAPLASLSKTVHQIVTRQTLVPTLTPQTTPFSSPDDYVQPRGGYQEVFLFQENQYGLPYQVNLDDVALALHWTSNLNRRLQLASLRSSSNMHLSYHADNSEYTQETQQPALQPPFIDNLRGGESFKENHDNDERQQRPYRIPQAEPSESSLSTVTVFHAISPRPSISIRRGDDSVKESVDSSQWQWGPNLNIYLGYLTEALGLNSKDDMSLELSLAMIFLDRASSIDTPRTTPPVPYCVPRTVHRLILTALLLSMEAVHDVSVYDLYFGNLEALGIPLVELEQMTGWMRNALGGLGYRVSLEQLKDWREVWEARFDNSLNDNVQHENQEAPFQERSQQFESEIYQASYLQNTFEDNQVHSDYRVSGTTSEVYQRRIWGIGVYN